MESDHARELLDLAWGENDSLWITGQLISMD